LHHKGRDTLASFLFVVTIYKQVLRNGKTPQRCDISLVDLKLNPQGKRSAATPVYFR
jgi:hypothetical protein